MGLLCVAAGCGRTELVVGRAPVACDERVVDGSAHRIELRSGVVEVDLRLRGARLNATDTDRGWLTFREVSGRATARVALGRLALAPFDVRLVTGVYDVSYDAPTSSCSGRPDGLPCLGGVVLRGLRVRPQRQRVHIDMNPTRYRVTVRASGWLTDRALRFHVRCDGSEWTGSFEHNVEASIEALDPKRCSMRVFGPEDCANFSGCDTQVMNELEFDPAQPTLNIPLRTARVRVRLATTPQLGPTYSRIFPLIALQPRFSKVYFAAPGATDVEQVIELPLGTYDLYWPLPCIGSEPVTKQCGEVAIARGLRLTEDTTITRTLPFARWQGTLSFSGDAPNWSEADGVRLQFFSSFHYEFSLDRSSASPRTTDRFEVDHWVPSDARGFSLLVPRTPIRDEEEFTRTYRPSLIAARVAFDEGLLAAQDRSDFSFALRPLAVESVLGADGALSPLGLPIVIGTRSDVRARGSWIAPDSPTFVSFDGDFDAFVDARTSEQRAALERAGLPPVGRHARGAVRRLPNGNLSIVLDTFRAHGAITLDGVALDQATGREATVEFTQVLRSPFDSTSEGPTRTQTRGSTFSTPLYQGHYTTSITQGDCSAFERSDKLCGTVLVRGCGEATQ
ncbi:MAG: hypothetical protein JNK05_37260 [Myxococcales bacterium]|nr:hypothetical protein [Myxococcales bacterium]